MSAIEFTESSHPHLMGTALKGKFLTEFVNYVEANATPGAIGMSADAEFLKHPAVAESFRANKKVADGIRAAVDHPGALEHGIDARDMKALAKNAVGNTAAEQNAAQQHMAIFSLCLAKQEGQEAEYYDITKKALDNTIEAIRHNAALPNADPNDISTLAINIVIQEANVANAKKRGSLIHEELHNLTYGNPTKKLNTGMVRLLDHAIAAYGGLNMEEHAGRVEVQRRKQGILGQVRNHLGISAREIE